MVSISGYQITEQLYNGSRTLVYRAIREADQKPVVIKLLKNSHPDFNELLQFRNQYTIGKNLNYSGIIQTYSLENYQNGYALVMEDMQGVSLSEYMAGENITSLQNILSIAIQITDILHNLHQNRVIHKDIKPANILINPETKEIKLIDFSISSLLPKETQEIKNPNVLEGTLAYLSPEQTGRMNRGVDFRADFYALGVTLFELLTGELPFKSDDAVELVHCHIAQTPASINQPQSNSFLFKGKEIHEINKPHPDPLLNKERGQEIYPVINNIVMKLMAKNAEDRYQSALGLKHDLEKCLYQLKETGEIEDFEIALLDICDRFIIPERLYGREREVEQLLATFGRVSNGNRELMLVAGFSGIGKTAVINEVHKPIVKQRGYFIKGKFDQFNRNIPLDAFVQAFRSLIGQLLGESDAQLSSWKNKVLQALGDNAQVIIDVIPELEKIVGKQPSVSELSGTAAQNRFNLLFQKFIQVFTTKEHPLVVFLDDLQWADSASLKLMQLLMSESENGYLLLIGAYRDNEVFPAHPLILTLEEILKSEAIVNTITLTPLKQESLNQLVGDTLNCSGEIAQPLTQLIYQKTKGNPFFSTQFLKALYEDGLIKFDSPHSSQGGWICDISKVKALSLSDDVVEFMALQLQKLPESTQTILKLAACIGNQFDLKTASIVSQNSESQTALHLWKALQVGLILPTSQVYKFYLDNQTQDASLPKQVVNYKFLHDRVQQAAYLLIPEAQKQATHLSIGQSLLKQLSDEQKAERIFDIVNQLNLGQAAIKISQEKLNLARLNLQAGKKAKLSVAYQAAKSYLTIGINLLSKDAWQTDYELIYSLHYSGSEVAYLSGDFELAESLYAEALNHAQTSLDKAAIYRVQMTQYQLQGKNTEAIEIQRQSLQLLGWEMPTEPEVIQVSLNEEISTVEKFLEQHTVESILDFPPIQDSTIAEILRILQILFYTAWLSGQPYLAFLAIAKMTTLSLQHGNSDMSPFGYVGYGMISIAALKDYDTARRFGETAVQLCEQFDNADIRGMTNFLFAGDVHSWSRPIREADTYYDNAYKYSMEAGNWLTVSFMMMLSGSDRLTYGKNLNELYEIAKTSADFLYRIKSFDNLENFTASVLQPIRNLLGLTKTPFTFDDDNFSESKHVEKYSNNHFVLAWFYAVKIRHAYLFDNKAAYLDLIPRLKIIESAVKTHAKTPSSVFYVALMHLDLIENSEDETELQIHLQALLSLEEKLKVWAQACPENVLHKCLLIKAEKARLNGQKSEAIDLYEQAITKAQENEYIYEAALGNELAAKFYLGWNKEKVASGYMQEAYYCYARWGSSAKTDDLEKRYPQLLTAILQTKQNNLGLSETFSSCLDKSSIINQTFQTTRSSSNIDEALDLGSILKATQALSNEIQLEQLISKLMQVVMENAGAKKAALILLDENTSSLILKAVATTSKSIKLLDLPYQDSKDIPTTLINHVKRTQKIIVLDDATQDSDFIIDSYLIHQQPKSLLCMPILGQGKLIGLLYLENNLTIGAFTQNRVEISHLLCTQAAISLKNAQLYNKLENYSHTLEEQVEQRTQEVRLTLKELQQTQAQLIQNEKMSSLGQLVAGIAHEINNPISFIYGNLTPASEYTLDLIELINLYQNVYPESLPEIASKIEDIELEYLIDDLPKLLDSMQTGAVRIREIVLSLRSFSRLDESEIKPVDIHSGIDSTLLILQHKFHSNHKYPEIEVIKTYSELPDLNCYVSELNQVFLNIICNAIDALREKQENKPKITINTSLKDNNNILISIKDNGIGISKPALNKIFDPFFTTKPVGSGTGLGLSTSYSIVVEKHRGNLTCVSAPGEGTEFLIELPIKF